MATWQDQYRTASFRGVPFAVQSADSTFGRRVVKHEFPGRDKPFMEDLGRAAREFTIEAIILGADYMSGRDALIAAIESFGSGKLVHPYYGELTVSITSAAKVKESTAEGGSARISFTCTEAGENIFPTQVTSLDDQVTSAVDGAQAQVQADFAASFVATQVQPFVAIAAQAQVGGVLSAISAAAGQVTGAIASVAALERAVTDATGSIVSLVGNAAGAAASIVGNLQLLTRTVATDARSALDLARQFYGYGADLVVVPTSTPSRVIQAQNQAAVVSLVRVAALGEGVQALHGVTFDSYQEAQGLLEETIGVIDDVMLTASDDVYDSLRALRLSVVRDINARGADLTRLVTLTTVITEPALTLAYRLYGASRVAGDAADDILARNAIGHPMFVPAGAALEVLANG